jgi:hypothetical protein
MRRQIALVAVAGLLPFGLAMIGTPGVAQAATGARSASHPLLPAHSFAGAGGAASPSSSVRAASLATSGLEVVASGLNQPHGLTVGPDGNLYVAEVGDGQVAAGCTDGTEPACANTSGTIDRVTPAGVVTHVVTGLSSAGDGSGLASAGVAGVAIAGTTIGAVVQDQGIDPTTGANTYGAAGATLGDIVTAPLTGGPATKLADLAHFEALNNPDMGAGSSPDPTQGEPAIDSDPYGIIAFNGGWAVADAAANDVLFVSKAGAVSVLAVLPLIPQPFMGSTAMGQAVPTSLAIGPDGSLYVGQLGGGPNDVGDVNVYKINANKTVTAVATGLTMIGGIAFDHEGRLLVLEIDTAGLDDQSAFPAHGAVIRIEANGSKTTLAGDGLEFPLGLTVGADDTIYTTNYGVLPGVPGAVPGATGEIVKIGGYRLAASDGGVFNFGSYGFYGSLGGIHLSAPVVGLASDTSGPGYWLTASDGGVFNFGHAGFFGSLGAVPLAKPIVAITPTPDGGGYWLVASDGGVFNFGDAGFFGSLGGIPLTKPIVAMASSADGGGYYLFASDGGVFNFGDAGFFGSLGGIPLTKPIVAGAATITGGGYELVASDGGVFNFGDAGFFGSLGSVRLNKPIVGIQLSGTGGYNLVAADGGIFAFGEAHFAGSLGGITLTKPIIGIG